MDTFKEYLLESCNSYQKLHEQIEAATAFAESGKFAEVALAVEEFKATVTDIKRIDKKIYAMSNLTAINDNADLWTKRTQHIETTLRFHQKSLPHLQSIMAVQQAELKKIKSGMKGMSGYHTGTKQTGRLLHEST